MRESNDLIDAMMSIMRNKRGSTRVVELAAELIAADARFNGKIAVSKKENHTGTWILEAIEFAGQVVDDCQQLDRRFADSLSRDELCDALLEIRNRIDSFVVK